MTRLNFVRMEKKSHGRRSRHLENRVDPGNGVSFSLLCRGSFSGRGKDENRRERRKTGKMKNRGSAEEDGNPSCASFCFFPGSACLLFTSPHFPARTKRRPKRPLWRREGLALFASRSETWKSETDRHFILAPESLLPSISFPTQRPNSLSVRSSRQKCSIQTS